MSDYFERFSVFIPPYIKVEIGLDVQTKAIVERVLDHVEGKLQKQVDALAGELNASTGALETMVGNNPDPNPND